MPASIEGVGSITTFFRGIESNTCIAASVALYRSMTPLLLDSASACCQHHRHIQLVLLYLHSSSSSLSPFLKMYPAPPHHSRPPPLQRVSQIRLPCCTVSPECS